MDALLEKERIAKMMFVLRTLSKRTQSRLTKSLKVSFQQIQKYESGHNALSSLKLLEVSNFFKKPLEYFTSDATELLGKVKLPDDNSVIVTESLENV